MTSESGPMVKEVESIIRAISGIPDTEDSGKDILDKDGTSEHYR